MKSERAKSLSTLKSPTVLKAVTIAVLSMVLFSTTHVSVRFLSDTMSTFEIVFWRMLLSMAMLMPWFAWKGIHLLRTQRPGLHAIRAVVNFGGMFLWFYAISFVPLGKAVAIHFTLPLFLLVLAAIFLRERVGIRRITATLVGFGGALVILQPGSAEIGWPELMILGSAVLYATTVIFLKHMLRTETPLAVTFYTNAFIFLFCIPPAIWFWVGPNVDDIVPILVIGVTGTFAPLMYASALRMVDASIIAPTDFLRLPITAGFAFALFGEIPTLWVWVGGGVIFTSTWYITARESRLDRNRRAAAAAANARAADPAPNE
jgi:drug/metabolite transporter (DMT)-like permease